MPEVVSCARDDCIVLCYIHTQDDYFGFAQYKWRIPGRFVKCKGKDARIIVK